MAGDCPNFAESAEQNGTVPLSEAILLDALSVLCALVVKNNPNINKRNQRII
jgi:hypothetical protein